MNAVLYVVGSLFVAVPIAFVAGVLLADVVKGRLAAAWAALRGK